MNQASDINLALEEIKSMLSEITELNGYNFTPTLKQGWLQHIFQRRSQETTNFPLIAYRPELSAPQGGDKTDNQNLKDVITFSIDGAVSVKSTDTPVEDLFNLLKDVRRSLVFDPNNPKLKLSKIDFRECPFDVPEAGEEYAFFSQKIQFNVVEQYAQAD